MASSILRTSMCAGKATARMPCTAGSRVKLLDQRQNVGLVGSGGQGMVKRRDAAFGAGLDLLQT